MQGGFKKGVGGRVEGGHQGGEHVTMIGFTPLRFRVLRTLSTISFVEIELLAESSDGDMGVSAQTKGLQIPLRPAPAPRCMSFGACTCAGLTPEYNPAQHPSHNASLNKHAVIQ